MRFIVTYIAGPLLAFLPERWRRAIPVAGTGIWERAALLSGLVECVAGLTGLGYWYMRSTVPMIRAGAGAAADGGLGSNLTEHQIGAAALFVFATHPLTWLLAFVFAEGALRLLCALVAEEARGSFPLYLLDRAAYLAAHPQETRNVAREIRRNFIEVSQRLHERILVAPLKHFMDEVQPIREDGADYLEIRASRKKEGWDPPKVVRVDEAYFRLEESFVDTLARDRPFRYRLRRLEAGVPGRNVLVYRSGVAGSGRNRL